MCDNTSLHYCLKKCIYGTCSAMKRVSKDMLFEPLRYGTLWSRDDVAGGKSSGQRGRKVADTQGGMLKIVTRNHEPDM